MHAPRYVIDFKCIADKCRHSCCIGWEIEVDDETYDKYRFCDAVGKTRICQTVKTDADGVHSFIKQKDRRCPHLTDGGLCGIIRELGDGFLCDICREHPRFYHECGGRDEMGVGLSCEAAAELILSRDDYGEIVPFDFSGDDGSTRISDSFDPAAEREAVYAILGRRDAPYRDRLEAIRKSYGVITKEKLDSALCLAIRSFEYLDSNTEKMLTEAHRLGRSENFDEILERALAYFIFRYASKTVDWGRFSAAISLAFALEEMLACMLNLPTIVDESQVFECARRLSEEIEYSEKNVSILDFLINS